MTSAAERRTMRATRWRERAGGVLRLRVHELRAAGIPVLQAAAAAGIAWAIAHDVLDHARPFFAPIAATIVLGLAPGRRSRRAVEMVIGVALGIAVGDLLIAAIGSGAAQIALVVLLAMTAAILLGGGPLVVSQAATSAVLVAALPSSHAVPTRFVDALVGGLVGLAVLVAVPRNPLTVVRRITRPLFAELRSVLEGIAVALDRRRPRRRRAAARAGARDERLRGPPAPGARAGRGDDAPRARRTGARAARSSATSRPLRTSTSPSATCACSRARRSP